MALICTALMVGVSPSAFPQTVTQPGTSASWKIGPRAGVVAPAVQRNTTQPSRGDRVTPRIPPPLTVKVQQETYSIVVVNFLLDSYGGQGMGDTDDQMRVVRIHSGQNLCDEMDTVMHELEHAMIKTIHSPDMQTTHDFIFDTATPFVDLLRDNPNLVSYLLKPRPPCRSTGR